MTSLNGKVALVTGAAQGLGLGIAIALREAGAKVALADIQESELANALSHVLSVAGGGDSDVAAFTVDLTDGDLVKVLPDRVATEFGQLDILVNNAGVRSIAPFLEQSIEDWHRAIQVNLTAPYLLSQAVIPHMLARGGGKIVNVTSVASKLGFKNRSAYNVSKAGLTMLTKSIALELAGQGINCNAVAPGVIETPLNSHYFEDESFTKVIVDNTPSGTWGKPADIGAAVAFLCSPAADFINGVTVPVDGGWSTGKGY